MLPALRGQLPLHPITLKEHLSSASNFANLRDSNPRNSRRNRFPARCGKQQLVILPSVQSEAKLNLPRWPADGGDGDLPRLDFGPDPAFVAKVAEISGESIADINHG